MSLDLSSEKCEKAGGRSRIPMPCPARTRPYVRLGPNVVERRACCLKMPPCLFHLNPGCFAKVASTVSRHMPVTASRHHNLPKWDSGESGALRLYG